MKKLIISVIALVALLANVPTSTAEAKTCKRTVYHCTYDVSVDCDGCETWTLKSVEVETKYVKCGSSEE